MCYQNNPSQKTKPFSTLGNFTSQRFSWQYSHLFLSPCRLCDTRWSCGPAEGSELHPPPPACRGTPSSSHPRQPIQAKIHSGFWRRGTGSGFDSVPLIYDCVTGEFLRIFFFFFLTGFLQFFQLWVQGFFNFFFNSVILVLLF